jgi:uncharacterized protein YjdB
MRTIRRARGLAAALLLSIAGTSCREPAAPSGPGRLAPTNAALAFSSVLPESSGEPVIPLRAARVRLFRLPGQVPERAVVDTVVPFSENDAERSLTLGVVVTMVSERFGIELSLIDDQQQVVYRARDTVVAYTSGHAPPSKPVVLRYVGADTAVARIALAVDEGAIEIGAPTPLQVSAFLRDGRPTSARFGFAVRGTQAITVDASGVLHASAPVPPGSAWVVARIATGLADSVSVAAIVPAASISLTPAGRRIDVGDRLVLDAVVRDAAGSALAGRRVVWSSSDESIATVANGVVTARARGAALITAQSGRATSSVAVAVGPARVARVVPSVSSLRVAIGRTVSIDVQAQDADGVALPGRTATWSLGDAQFASIATPPGAPSTTVAVRGLELGNTTLVVDVEGVTATIPVQVDFARAARVTITPRALTLTPGDAVALSVAVEDSAGEVQVGRGVNWRSLDPTVTTVDGSGVVRAIAVGVTSIVASVDGVADTIPVVMRRLIAITITRVGTTVDQRGEVATFRASAFDQFGAPIANPSVQWVVTPGATLSAGAGPQTDLVLPPGASVVLSAIASGVRADLAVSAAPVTPPPVGPPEPPTVPPPTPPRRF